MLWLGCGVLALGLGAAAAGWLIIPFGPNVNVTIFNVAALLSSICQTGSAIALLANTPGKADPRRRRRHAVYSYLTVVVSITLLAFLAAAGLTPQFFRQGMGPLPLRQDVLEYAIPLYIFAALVIFHRFTLQRARFCTGIPWPWSSWP
jgi:hypothetical protein